MMMELMVKQIEELCQLWRNSKSAETRKDAERLIEVMHLTCGLCLASKMNAKDEGPE